jgi:uncharacterized repeat protein (TIGR03803 family)
LHTFTGGSDGANPSAGLVLSGNSLYGTTFFGGNSSDGTALKVNTDGAGYKVLESLDGVNNEAYPETGLVLSGNTLYGTTFSGGAYGDGAVFSLSFRPQPTIIPSGPKMILTWPTNYAGFDYSGYILQSTANLVSPVWSTNLPSPVVVNGQNTVTNPISGTQQFFRLSQ